LLGQFEIRNLSMAQWKNYLIGLIGLVNLAALAGPSVQVEWWKAGGFKQIVMPVRAVYNSDANETSFSLKGISGAVKIPSTAPNISLRKVKLWGDPTEGRIGWAYTSGDLQIRAMVRYFWPMDGTEIVENALPTLELFVHKSYLPQLPHMVYVVEAGIDEFTVANEDFILKKLFNRMTLHAVQTKRILMAEIDADLLLRDVNFGEECGTRYSATVVDAKPWKNGLVTASNRGMDVHC
jgi:hypothetical protein